MRNIRVHYDNGDSITTSINGTDSAILDHYIGRTFNLGTGGNDLPCIAVSVDFMTDEHGNEYLPFYDGFDIEFTHNGKRCAPLLRHYGARNHDDAKRSAFEMMSRAYGSPVVITSVNRRRATRINETNHCGKLVDFLFCQNCGCRALVREISPLQWGNMHEGCKP